MNAVRELFHEYAASLGFSLCFQSFDKELAGLPGDYALPSGGLLLATLNNEMVGCVALHRLDDHACEMKRLYVRPAARGHRTGRRLVEAVITLARHIGYRQICLHTIRPTMETAFQLYLRLGFRESSPYRENPVPGATYLQLDL